MVIGIMMSHGERSKLERIAIRLFAVVERCEDPTVQHKLRELAEELAKYGKLIPPPTRSKLLNRGTSFFQVRITFGEIR